MAIAFLGLGRMGALMAGRLISSGYSVVVWNRSKEKTKPLVDAGAIAAATPAEAVRGSDLVITMLYGPEAVESVLFGPNGAAEGLAPGTILVEMSTIGPAAVADIGSRLPAGVRLVDAPVKGSLPAAGGGTLKILAGGASSDVEECRKVLSELGTVVHCGYSGSGAATKLVVNIAIGSTYVMIAEALALADRLGISESAALDALEDTAVAKAIPGVRAALAVDERPTNFSLGLAEKDLGLALASGVDGDGLVAGARNQLSRGVHEGLAEKDLSAVLRHVRKA